ncbi:MAG: glycosyltransferase family 4 protein [Acidimicrobiales bacterium]|nr:glycosyltransferase family 4 protein [Acidimicrobiales bacterium]
MKVDFVIPRYGPVGGAENAVGALARRLARQAGWTVGLHTTCANSSNSWANEHAPGTTVADSLMIHRHLVDSGRNDAWSPLERRIQLGPSSVDPTTQDQFFFHQGPVSEGLADAVQQSVADLVLFAPYLFWPTIAIAPQLASRGVIIPAAHDEPFLRLSRVGEMLEKSRGLIYGSLAEQHLLQRTHSVAHLPSVVLGWGIEEPLKDDPSALSKLGLSDKPYVICVGRIEHAKGTLALVDFWRTHKSRSKSDHQLVLLGEPSVAIDSDDDVLVVRGADDVTKWSLLRGADFLINPSALESFSLVLFEAWAAGIPVLVNGHCETTRTHVARGMGGLWYRSYPEFEIAVHRLTSDRSLRTQLATNGHNFGETFYNWDKIVQRFIEFCDHIT